MSSKSQRRQRWSHKVWVRNPASGLEKRQYTLELASPKGTNISPGIILHGTGKRILQDEIQTYHKSVDIFWQANAWVDTNVCVDWVQKTLAPAAKNMPEFLLFCDNLEAQISFPLQEGYKEIEWSGLVWH